MGGNLTSPNLPSVLSVTPQVTTHSAKHTEATEGKLVLNEKCVEAWAEVCLERIGEDNSEEEEIFRDLWEDQTQREMVIDCLKADCEVRTGRPPDL